MTHKVEDYLKLVHKIAHRYSKRSRLEHEDIFQEGCIGLMKACREYKEGEVPFRAFAAIHIQFAILTALKQSHTFHIDSRTIEIAMKINKRGLKELPATEIAEKLNRRLDLVERALDFLKSDVLSLDYEYQNNGEKEDPLSNWLCYEQNFDDHIYIEQMLDIFKVPERDKTVVRMMLDGYKTTEVAALIGENHGAVTQRKLNRKKNMMHKKHLVYV